MLLTKPFRHGGVVLKGRTYKVKYYVCVNVTVRSINLNIPPVSGYPKFLFNKIIELHNSGLGYKGTSYWLNENGYKTVRGHDFQGTHVVSIFKREYQREVRINRPYELTYGEWSIRIV